MTNAELWRRIRRQYTETILRSGSVVIETIPPLPILSKTRAAEGPVAATEKIDSRTVIFKAGYDFNETHPERSWVTITDHEQNVVESRPLTENELTSFTHYGQRG